MSKRKKSSYLNAGQTAVEITRPAARPYTVPAVCIFLLLAVGLVFGQTVHHEFVNYDDDRYVYENPPVPHGLTAQGIAWAFTSKQACNWHPLTWLSHMLDCQVYGLKPAGHHLTNVLLHAGTAILLFLVLLSMTGDLWPSAFAAAVFAVHPLRVESVAWVSERKDVLSGLLFMLTLWAYVGYVRHRFSFLRYTTVVVLFALGLMTKPMLVTLPFVLLLLDYWPLKRMSLRSSNKTTYTFKKALTPGPSPKGRGEVLLESLNMHSPFRLIMEKLPLLVLAGASCMVTLWAQESTIAPSEALPLSWRIGNAMVAYVSYLGKFFYPAGLAVFYPHPISSLPTWKVLASLLILAIISWGVIFWRRRHPYLLTGWFWNLGMLVPVIGLVQVGWQAMADRYTYLPQIGLCIALAWGVGHACRYWPNSRRACGIASALALAALIACAWRQTSYWLNSETLWTHALEHTSGNSVAHYNLGKTLFDAGRVEETIDQYRKALQINPNYFEAHSNLGIALMQTGRAEEGREQFLQALQIKPDLPISHYNLGNAYAATGQRQRAIEHYERALALKPDYIEAHNNLGVTLIKVDRPLEAIEHYLDALKVNADDCDTLYNLGNALLLTGRVQDAIGQYERAVQLKPNYAEAHNNLGSALLQAGRPEEAIEHYKQALKINPQFLDACKNLAVAYDSIRQSSEAVAAGKKALEIARSQGQTATAKQLEELLKTFEGR
jgi:protein O-mannosyl-transferase